MNFEGNMTIVEAMNQEGLVVSYRHVTEGCDPMDYAYAVEDTIEDMLYYYHDCVVTAFPLVA